MTAVLPTPVGPRSGRDYVPVHTRHGFGVRASYDASVRLVSMGALWLSLVLVAFWWAADHGVSDLGGWATGLVSLGRISGLVASVLLLVQVVLMARVPAIERAFGQDRLARQHRLVGFTSFNLMLVHVVLITWGYAAGRVLATPGELWHLLVDYPGMLLAGAGALCLCLVVLTSIRAARRRLRYESWHLLHLYAYLGVGFALPHQLWTGQQFIDSPAKTLFWWTAWGLAAGAVLVWRVGVPAWRNLRHGLRVAAVVPEGAGIHSVHMTGRALHRLQVEPGQFFTWRFLGGPGWTRANPYSLSAAPDGRSLRITVQTVGDGSTASAALRPGTRVLVEGPFGRLSPRAHTREKVAFIGAGVGMTPLRALAEGLPYAAGDAIYVERFRDRPLFAREIDTIAAQRGMQVLRLPGARRRPGSWLGDGIGTASDLTALTYWIPDVADRDVYVCGPGPWAARVERTLLDAGVPREHIHLESFAW